MQVDVRELEAKAFQCLEGCGFCCTFQPEASQRELALLRARLRPKPLAVVVGEGRSYLALQNKCGACTLLERRSCAAYDLRPSHCRYFPFHVHFGPAPQAYVNMTCRGVDRADGARLHGSFDHAVLAHANPEELARHEREARATYAEFERRATQAGAWGDARAVVAEALGGAPFTRAWMERAIERAAEDASPEDALADAWSPFSAPDVTKRPFYLAPDLRWLTFEGPTRVVEMNEKGALVPFHELPPPDGWHEPSAELAAGLTAYLSRLAARDVFVGSVYALVDELDYESTVEEAAWWRLVEVSADLLVRARTLAAMGVREGDLAAETERFYDSTFLDAPTIGGFL